ncbi:hypothetical protein C8Q77DRAFT_158188 [Trametes polyzona]|nr:hypothetical protein C8Q77DRAFT_158188 [Trametes polyzona]
MAHKAARLDADEFMDHFFPYSPNPPSPHAHADSTPTPTPTAAAIPQWDSSTFGDLEGAERLNEKELSSRFIKAIETVVPDLLKLSESQDKPDKGDLSGQKIDAAFFRPDSLPTDGRPHWADQMVAVEFKTHDKQNDPFDDQGEDTVEGDSNGRREVRGQLIEYAEQVFKYQHRTALFMLLVMGRRFRFLRWDRSGTIVTPSIDYYVQPQVLCEMLWRMAHLTEVQLGCDPSATRLCRTDADYITMNVIALPVADDLDHTEYAEYPDTKDYRVFRYVRAMFSHSIQGNWPRYRLEVFQDGKKFLFLVGKPVYHTAGMAGRGTQGFVAYDLQRKRFVWLKDAWRAHYDFVDQEGTILMQLNNTKDAEGNPSPVANVPTVVCHGDVRGQTTRTPEFWEMKNDATSAQDISSSRSTNPTQASLSGSSRDEEASASTKGKKRSRAEAEKTTPDLDSCPLRRHMHYRLVVEEVAMPLRDFKGGFQLLTIILDCILAHEDAVNKAKIMHRDISGGNILIFPRALSFGNSGKKHVAWRGLLADWELSKPIGGVHDDRARQPERTGTWQYMSVAILLDHSKVVEISDELESFFHVLLYYALRYLRSNCLQVGSFIETFFDADFTDPNGKRCCGPVKMGIMTGTQPLTISPISKEPIKFASKPLNEMFEELLTAFRSHYIVRDYEAQNRPQPSESPSTPAPEPPVDTDPIIYACTSESFFGNRLAPINATPPSIPAEPLQLPPHPARLSKPSDEVIANAKKASSHGAILAIIHKAWNRHQFGEFTVDRVDDKVPVTYKAQGRVGPADSAATSTVKRRRMQTIQEGAEGSSKTSRRPPRKTGSCKI